MGNDEITKPGAQAWSPHTPGHSGTPVGGGPGAGPHGTRPLPWVGQATPPQLTPPVDPYWPPVEADPAIASVDLGYPIYATTAPPRRRRRRRTVLLVLAGLAVLCCSGVILTLLNPALTGPTHGAAGLDTAVRDGAFEFVVAEVSCAHASVGRAPFVKTAQGQYCLVSLTVRNIGTKAQTFADGFQKALGPDNTRYSADTAAGLLINPEAAALWNVINPGNTVHATIAYDIPAATHIDRIELHDSGMSRGVIVTLT